MGHLARPIQNHVVDVADLLVCLIVHIDASELRTAPFAHLMRGSTGSLRRRRAGYRCGSQECYCKPFGNHDVPPLFRKTSKMMELWCGGIVSAVAAECLRSGERRA